MNELVALSDFQHSIKADVFGMRFDDLVDQLYSKKVDPGLIRAHAWKLDRAIDNEILLERTQSNVRNITYRRLKRQLKHFDSKIVMALLT